MKNENLKKIANIILGIGIVITLIGAIYIAIVQKEYAISGCFVLSSVLMFSLMISSKKMKKDKQKYLMN